MDTTPKYILMCEKVEEIQRLWKPNVGDWFYKTDGIGFGLWLICKIEQGILLCSGERMSQLPFNPQLVKFTMPEEYIWLLSQTQLQDIYSRNLSLERRNWNAMFHQLICYLQNAQEFFKDGSFTQEYRHCRSWEQLWLAFVMKTKYQKIWKRKDWVKK